MSLSIFVIVCTQWTHLVRLELVHFYTFTQMCKRILVYRDLVRWLRCCLFFCTEKNYCLLLKWGCHYDLLDLRSFDRYIFIVVILTPCIYFSSFQQFFRLFSRPVFSTSWLWPFAHMSMASVLVDSCSKCHKKASDLSQPVSFVSDLDTLSFRSGSITRKDFWTLKK